MNVARICLAGIVQMTLHCLLEHVSEASVSGLSGVSGLIETNEDAALSDT